MKFIKDGLKRIKVVNLNRIKVQEEILGLQTMKEGGVYWKVVL